MENALGHLRRAQGLIREVRKERAAMGADKSKETTREAIAQMRRFNKIRVAYFRETLDRLKKQKFKKVSEHQAPKRKPGNPMLRYTHQGNQQVESDGQLRLVPLSSGPDHDREGSVTNGGTKQ